MNERNYQTTDHWLMGVDRTLRTLFGRSDVTERPNPAKETEEIELTDQERDETARQLRMSHTGEICAQAHNHARSMKTKHTEAHEATETAIKVNNDHLAWSEARMIELGGHKSLLNPLWYADSFFVGTATLMVSESLSKTLAAEANRQLADNLNHVLDKIPDKDKKTRVMLTQIQMEHTQQEADDGNDLPQLFKSLIKTASNMMAKAAYYF